MRLRLGRSYIEGWRNSREEGGVQPGCPPARGTRTIKQCSFDARNRGSTRLPLRGVIGKMRAVKDGLAAPLWRRSRIRRASLDGRSQKLLTPLLG